MDNLSSPTRSASSPIRIRVKELDLERIRPNAASETNRTAGGSKIVVLGPPGAGKSVVIKSILKAKSHLIPVGVAVSHSEPTNKFYSRLFPELFIYDEFDVKIIENIRQRQIYAKDNLPVAWCVLVLDDCMADNKVFNHKSMRDLIKNSRHWDLLSIYANQYVFDFKADIRASIGGVFILRQPNQVNRQKIFVNFAGIIPTFAIFCQLMDDLTNDYTCIYIDNETPTNDWQDCVFYYKAPVVEDFKFGCDEFWEFNEARRRR